MIGLLWLLTVLAACAAVAVGAFADRWLRWTTKPWWWVTVIAVELVGVGRFLGSDYWLISAVCAVCGCAAALNLRKAIVARRMTAARHRRTRRAPDAWERL